MMLSEKKFTFSLLNQAKLCEFNLLMSISFFLLLQVISTKATVAKILSIIMCNIYCVADLHWGHCINTILKMLTKILCLITL